MKRRNATRKALFASVVSLLLCVSMLVGTTFAWFTDEVVTGMNTIAAGNLDIELYAGENAVNGETKLFDDVALWEPGVVAYENLQVKNVGTLALKYQMALNFGSENDLNGHKLSDVLQVALIDGKIEKGADRATVLAAAKAAENVGSLQNFCVTGELEAGAAGDEQAIVIFWAPNDNETDNKYNANNGQKTSDGEPLHIEFGVNLQATQLMHENDSFGPDYDKFATILPKAKVTNQGAKTVTATLNGWDNGTEAEYNLPFDLKFEPNEKWWEDAEKTVPGTAQDSAYKYWHADYVVTADKDIPANSVALLGYYQAFCDAKNNGNWVALSADENIAANTEVRLVDVMGGGDGSGNGSIKVTYKDICQWGNDGVGFQCSAIDLTGENAGTTLTVELRMYANNSDPADSSYNNGDETGVSYVIGRYTCTFKNAVSTAEELKAQLAKGNDVILANDIIVDVAETGFVVAKDASAKIDLNGHDIIATSTSAANTQLFSVSGNLEIVGNGTISLNNDNFAWDTSARYTAINIRETGVVTLGEGVKVVCEGGSATADGYGMTYAVDIYTTGTLNVNGASLHSNYIAVRCFFGNSVVNVGSGSSITSSRNNYGIWPQSAPGAVITIDPSVTYTVDSNGIYIFG